MSTANENLKTFAEEVVDSLPEVAEFVRTDLLVLVGMGVGAKFARGDYAIEDVQRTTKLVAKLDLLVTAMETHYNKRKAG